MICNLPPGNSGFTTVDDGTSSDTIPPDVQLVTPLHNSMDAPVNTSVVITFTEPLDASTVNNDSFAIYAIAGSLSVHLGGREIESMALGKLLLILGLILALIGLVLVYAPGLFSWFGHLPGDIRRQGEHGTFFFPITSMIIISVVLSIIVSLFFRR